MKREFRLLTGNRQPRRRSLKEYGKQPRHAKIGFASTQMVRLSGRIISGHGWAGPCLTLQVPLITAHFPEIAACFRGSINVSLDTPLLIDKPDFVTPEINWAPNENEVFHFTRIRFTVTPSAGGPSQTYSAWIYGPQNSPHQANRFHLEIIAPHMDLGDRTQPCGIEIDRPRRTVPMIIID